MVARVIEDEASGMSVSKLTLAVLLGTTPTSRKFKTLVGSSRLYGLTSGGINSEEFALTPLGQQATGGDEVVQVAALKAAVMNVPPYKAFFEAFTGKKIPAATPLKDFLTKSAEIEADRTEEVTTYLLDDAKTAGLIRSLKGGGDWVDLSGIPAPSPVDVRTPEGDDDDGAEDDGDEDDGDEDDGQSDGQSDDGDKPFPRSGSRQRGWSSADGSPKKVFIAHGKNRVPLDQLKKVLDQFKVKYAVAVDEPNRGRPISKKVAELMEKECSSGIFIFTADELFVREKDGVREDVWRPSENVVYELGAASILYDNRIVIFKEKDVSFPSDFSDLGYIEFEKDQLVAEMGNLFSELVSLDILEVRAKG